MQIETLLIANRGEVVARIARTARRLGVRTVAVYAESDRHSPYVEACDLAVFLGDDREATPYLHPDRLVAAAELVGADAIHPGYGFLSENPAFATACIAAGLVWIGPTPEAIAEMGDKIRAKAAARNAGVPVLESVEVRDDLDEAAKLARSLDFPLLIKPAAGGGGKGMHRVDAPEQLLDELRGARREAVAAFGDGTLFTEPYIDAARHVEIQVLGDAQGNVVHLGERECSIQRRHQKIIEEAPSPALDPGLRQKMADAAVALAEAIEYRNAGTVEFLLFDDKFAFLEMNTRLQVEHPVTEQLTGLDLVELQLRIAEGRPLPLRQEDVRISGHAIEVRLYAEDPRNGFLPSAGIASTVEFPDRPEIRIETGIRSGTAIGTRYDPMVAKVIAHGADRNEAALKLRSALEDTCIAGLTTNRNLLARILRDDDFLAGRTTTDFLDRHPEMLDDRLSWTVERALLVGGALHALGRERVGVKTQAFTPRSWRNVRSQPETVSLLADGRDYDVKLTPQRDGIWLTQVEDDEATARVIGDAADTITLEYEGIRRRIITTVDRDRLFLSAADGAIDVEIVPRFRTHRDEAAGSGPLAPVPGTVVEVPVRAGEKIVPGQTLVVLEAMKMEHRLDASANGTVLEILVSPGDNVEAHQLLMTIEEAVDE